MDVCRPFCWRAPGWRAPQVTAFVSDNYIGCRDHLEIGRVFADFGTIKKRDHGAALKLRHCVFLTQGDLVTVVDDNAPSLTMSDGSEMRGYYVAKHSGPVVWFPVALLTNFAELPKEEQREPFEPQNVPDLAGPFPVGRWAVVYDFVVDTYIDSNDGWLGYSGEGPRSVRR